MVTHNGHRRLPGIAVALATTAAAVAGWFTLGVEDEPVRRQGVVVVNAGIKPAATDVVPRHEPEGTSEPSPVTESPSSGMTHALALPPGAVMRNVTTYSRSLGISCGEVTPGADPGAFRRFFFISSMTTGRVDDGTEEFRSHAATVCISRE